MMDVQDKVEAAITRTLEKRREPVVPAEFAARVMGALPPLRTRQRRMPVGRATAMAAMVAMALTMFALASQARPEFSNFAFDLELLLLVQMGGLGWWVVGRQGLGNRD
jgi:hypothetical protein